MSQQSNKNNKRNSNKKQRTNLVDNTSALSNEHKKMLEDVLNKIQHETNDVYQLSITKIDPLIELHSVDTNNVHRSMQIRVFDMEKKFKQLEGVYNSNTDILKRIEELRVAEGAGCDCIHCDILKDPDTNLEKYFAHIPWYNRPSPSQLRCCYNKWHDISLSRNLNNANNDNNGVVIQYVEIYTFDTKQPKIIGHYSLISE